MFLTFSQNVGDSTDEMSVSALQFVSFANSRCSARGFCQCLQSERERESTDEKDRDCEGLGGESDRQTEGETDRQTDRQTDTDMDEEEGEAEAREEERSWKTEEQDAKRKTKGGKVRRQKRIEKEQKKETICH